MDNTMYLLDKGTIELRTRKTKTTLSYVPCENEQDNEAMMTDLVEQ